MNDLAKKWGELEFVFSPAAAHARRYDLRENVDWNELENYLRIGALATACAMMEAAGLKGRDDHVSLLFELRNAVIHNAGDIAHNRNRSALSNAQSYLQDNKHLQLSAELHAPFFALNSTVVTLNENIYFAIRLCMLVW